ncbi:TIR domain-containing protein [Nostoc sp. CALU 546]|uniref:TIR domain-containing protein n=1 Tax=Nostoc sp. CALU 546 TaxID=1867241 RepID=UPI003B67153B
MLSDEQRRRLEQEKNSFEQSYELQSEKITRLRNALVIETDPSRKFQYEQQIKNEETELKKLTDRLDEIEKQLQSAQSIPIISEPKSIQQTNIQQQKILILAANPQQTSRLHLEEELREIKEGLKRAKKQELFLIELAEAVRYRDIHRSVIDFEPQIIHFSGRSSKQAGLVFENEAGQAKLIDAEALAGLFELFSDHVKCVVLNACYSEIQAKAIAQHIDYVIGMCQKIGDRAAIEFAVGFYDALGAGKSIEYAYKLGCRLIRVAGMPESLTPKLLIKKQLDDNFRIEKAITVAEKEVFISYAWGGDSEELVNQLDKAFQKKGVTIVRDKRDLGYKGLIKEFMERIGQGKCVITVISDKYLKSPNCMFELVKVTQNGNFYDRIFPVVLADAQIYKPVERIKYIKYWEEQIKELDEAMRSVSAANLQGIREEIDQYSEIRNTISELTSTLKNMNTLTPNIHNESDFQILFEAIEYKLKE